MPWQSAVAAAVTKWQRCLASLSGLRARGEGTACLGAQRETGCAVWVQGSPGLGVGEEEAVTLSGVLGLGVSAAGG